ncbi:hypothetical protein [Calothrix sp. NIES-3974]|nr:hypothetical protein [Calothrix sp. NIES-3974]
MKIFGLKPFPVETNRRVVSTPRSLTPLKDPFPRPYVMLFYNSTDIGEE